MRKLRFRVYIPLLKVLLPIIITIIIIGVVTIANDDVYI